MSNAEARHSITEGSIVKGMAYFFLPILMGTFFQQLYNTVDAIVVGNFVGKEALAAVGGATGTFINLSVGFFIGLSSGATVIISQFYGARDRLGTKKAVHTAVALAITCGLFLMAFGYFVSPIVLGAMGTPEDVLVHAITYLRIYFMGMIPNLFYNMGTGILRAVGDSKRPLYFLIFGTLINLVLDLLFVVVFGLGVKGVGIATITAQTLAAMLVFFSLHNTEDEYRLQPRSISFDVTILKNIVLIGIPAGLQSVMYGLSNLIIQSSINMFGTNAVAAWTAYGKIDGIFWMIMDAFGVAVATFVGQNFGARNFDRMRKSIKVCALMTMGTAVLLSLVLILLKDYVYYLFTDDEEVVRIGIQMIMLMVPYYFTYVGIAVLSSSIRGTGDAIMPMLLTGIGICGFRVVWVMIVRPTNPDLAMIIHCYPISWAITSVMFVIYYFKGKWFERRVAKLG